MTKHQILAIHQLRAHPLNSNVMQAEQRAVLKAHLARTGNYPPVIVRPLGEGAGGGACGEGRAMYQILDGHHRVEALRELGHAEVRCDVWAVDDAEALTLLATLNRLEGQDDARLRARLVDALSERVDRATLLARLPDDAERLDKLLALAKPAGQPAVPASLSTMPIAVHFFLLPADKRALEARLKAVGGTREEALMRLIAACDDASCTS